MLIMPKGNVEVLINNKWESVMMTDSVDEEDIKFLKETYPQAEKARFIYGDNTLLIKLH